MAALILIAGCASPQQQAGNNSGATPYGNGAPSGGTPAAGGSPSGGAATTSAKSYPDCVSSDCGTLSSDEGLLVACESGCAIDSAKATKDASVCENIKSLANATVYYVACLSTVAGEVGNVGSCDRLTNSSDKDMCIVESSQQIHDPSICDGVTDSMMKGICMQNANSSG